MKVKALKSFSGAVSMAKGDVRDINDEYILKDLIKAGYVVEEAKEPAEEKAEKPKKKTKKSGDAK